MKKIKPILIGATALGATALVSYLQSPHPNYIAYGHCSPTYLENIKIRDGVSLEGKVAEFSFKDLIGVPFIYPDMSYMFVAYDSKSKSEKRGVLKGQVDITSFLQSSEYDAMEIYRMQGDAKSINPAVRIMIDEQGTAALYDMLELGDFSEPRYLIDCFGFWSRNLLMNIWNKMHIIKNSIDEKKKQMPQISKVIV